MRALAAAFGVAGGASAVVAGIMLALSNARIGKGWTTPLQFLNTVNAKYMVAVILVQLGLLILLGAYLVLRTTLWGGLFLVVPAVTGLVLVYMNVNYRAQLLGVWALVVIFCWAAGIAAGYQLHREVEPLDG
jgi:hypothetical protein